MKLADPTVLAGTEAVPQGTVRSINVPPAVKALPPVTDPSAMLAAQTGAATINRPKVATEMLSALKCKFFILELGRLFNSTTVLQPKRGHDFYLKGFGEQRSSYGRVL